MVILLPKNLETLAMFVSIGMPVGHIFTYLRRNSRKVDKEQFGSLLLGPLLALKKQEQHSHVISIATYWSNKTCSLGVRKEYI